MEAIRLFKALTRDQRNTFLACFLGWALDALDFFLLTFVLVPVSHDFNQSIPEVAFAITLTLLMRPVGAFIFGWLGDKFGRRIPLMGDIIFYSAMELLTAFAPNFTVFLILRALFGIGMGGEWGLGASLAMESLPAKARGLFSGILQQGYAFGYLLAALLYWIIFPIFGWRGLFVAGSLPALLVIYIRARVPESPVWERQRRERKREPLKVTRFIKRRIVLLCRPSHDGIQLHVARDAGPLPDLPRKTARFLCQPEIDDDHYLRLGGHLWGNRDWVHVATMGAETQHYCLGDLWAIPDSDLDFPSGNRPAHRRWIPHAIHGAGRLGRDSGPSE
jgi:hypothetical protein